ncbi:MAG TPA: CHC2 zinc finger domain-containing protein [Nostocaceae cyanobacterium]|nr:CHC2 zinc finger domain-containing protein [Nostocaceae cyanobacterium]
MEIAEIKSRLSLSEVIRHYGLKADKQNRLCCPFHEDKTPSMQLYHKTQTAYCFSSNCRTHGRSVDVIDFIMYKDNVDKHQAIEKAITLVDSGKLIVDCINKPAPIAKESNPDRSIFLESMFQYFSNAIYNSKPAQEYLISRGFKAPFGGLGAGYNSGQFHHGTRKDEKLISQCLEVGLLIDKGQTAKTGDKAYTVFGKWCICFALRSAENQITGLYFRSTLNDKEQRHFYLKDRSGLYPGYPAPNTTKLILTESIIDAATLLQVPEIKEQYSVLAQYGTNGLTEEHQQAIRELRELKEIIFFLNGDQPGEKAVAKYAPMLKSEYPALTISSVQVPENEDVNSLLQGHTPEVLTHLINTRKECEFTEDPTFSFSTEESIEKKKPEPQNVPVAARTGQLESAVTFLKQKNLLKSLNKLIEQSGIIGEENSRLLLFLITISYLNKQPLHALVQGSSGSGKTHIIGRIADLMPPEDVLRFTRITESSLYNWGEFDLFQKIIIIEDLDGLKEDALYALREFISNQVLRSSVTIKDKKGNNKSSHKIVKGQFSSLSATTKGETYEDNMSRSFLLAVDESKEQTQRIITYQNKKSAGEISRDDQKKATNFVQQMVRNLKPYEVVNPYATKLLLPEKVHKVRRLNEMYQSVIKQVTLLNQYSRQLNANNELITDIDDIEQATEVLFESIVLKVDELDGSLRQFFERLKKYVKNDSSEFILREVRQEFNISKTQLFRYIQTLVELEYLKQIGGFANKGIKYKISYWDNYHKLRAEIKDFLLLQIQQLRQAEK